jgi:hypothetical protein
MATALRLFARFLHCLRLKRHLRLDAPYKLFQPCSLRGAEGAIPLLAGLSCPQSAIRRSHSATEAVNILELNTDE